MHSILIYGSCVSRDTYDFLNRDYFELLDYVSRQSVISAYHPVSPTIVSNSNMSSPFQIRNSVGDFKGDALTRLKDSLNSSNLVLWDLIDERNGVVEVSSGGYVTFTYDLYRADVFKLMKENGLFLRRILFGTDEHFELWCKHVDRFIADLKRFGGGEVLNKLFLIKAPWAVVTDTGNQPNHWKFGPTPVTANSLYRRYYDYIIRHKIKFLAIPSQLCITKTSHKWGPGPYHYIDAAYEFLAERINRLADSDDDR